MDFPHLRRFLKKEGYTYKKEGNTHFLKTRNLLIKKEGKKKEIYLPQGTTPKIEQNMNKIYSCWIIRKNIVEFT